MTISKLLGSFDAYAAESARRNIPPRCPYASVEVCPKYYEAVALLSLARVTAPLPSAEKERLDKKWKGWHSPMPDLETSAYGTDGRLSFSNLCPEVAFDVFGFFASGFIRYGDELDAERAYEQLAHEGVPATDFRWKWAHISPEHYTECRLYSVLSGVALDKPKARSKRTKAPIPKQLRWTVFTRDSLTCVYCGRKAPDVVLEVDHKVSEANGGSTTLDNLVTACEDCNRGKGSNNA